MSTSSPASSSAPRHAANASDDASPRSACAAAPEGMTHMSRLPQADVHRGVLAQDAVVVHHEPGADRVAQVPAEGELRVVAISLDAADHHGAHHHVGDELRADHLQVVHADGEGETGE